MKIEQNLHQILVYFSLENTTTHKRQMSITPLENIKLTDNYCHFR